MDCREATALIIEHQSETHGPRAAAPGGEHVSDCPDCVAFSNTYRSTIRAASALPSNDITPEASGRIWRSLLRRIAHPVRVDIARSNGRTG